MWLVRSGFDSRHTLTACGPFNGKEVKDVFRRPSASVEVDSTPSCPWHEGKAAGLNLETGQLSDHYIAEILLDVTLNHKKQNQETKI